jgi:proline dehydrogenase
MTRLTELPPETTARPAHAGEPEREHPLLRAALLYLSDAAWARAFITHFGLARRMASRFVAGETTEDAIRAIQGLNGRGIHATLDHLGESVTNREEAIHAADVAVRDLERIHDAGVRSNVSIKLTQMGLDLGEAFCIENVRRIVEKARELKTFVRIDMESSAHTEATLSVFRTLHAEFDNVGIVLQAYLYRTEADLLALIEEGARIRLCKGAYKEPPDKAYPLKADVDANFIHLIKVALDHAQRLPPADGFGLTPPLPAIATHDEQAILASKAYAGQIGLLHEYFEFQMLYGIRGLCRPRVRALWHPVVPVLYAPPGRAPGQRVVLPIEPPQALTTPIRTVPRRRPPPTGGAPPSLV